MENSTDSTPCMLPRLDAEVELISCSLLPAELLEVRLSTPDALIFHISSNESDLGLEVAVSDLYPNVSAITINVKGTSFGREEAQGWETWSQERLKQWDVSEEYPLFQSLSAYFLPLLAAHPASPELRSTESKTLGRLDAPHHALLTSHHLLSSTKRKNLVALSSELSLVGFSKIGHPGIMYAIGGHDDLIEWLREVKSWNWLALRVRVGVEPLPEQTPIEGGKGKQDGARGGKGRGEWTEMEKIGEALEWMKKRGRDDLLLDIGIGSGAPGR